VRYSIDTSALLDGWIRYYPPDIFPGLWRRLEALVATGDLAAIDEVLRELEKKDDDVHAWAKRQEGMWVAIDDDVQAAVAEILGQFEQLAGELKNRSFADPWVIALAQVHGCTVVTGEQPSGKLTRPRIPDVCDALGIRCITLLELIREEQWVFGGA